MKKYTKTCSVKNNLEETLKNALQELKRADHIFYVSLKYARTVDIMRNLIERLIASLEYQAETIAKKRISEGKLEELPESKPERARIILSLKQDENAKKIIDLLLYLRRIRRSNFERSREFRKNVTMTVFLEEGLKEITIEDLKEYLKKVQEYFEETYKLVKGEESLI